MRSRDKQKIGIAGGGLLGMLLAIKLAEQGADVTIFERESNPFVGGCASVAAGLLAPLAEIETACSIIYGLGIRSLALWPELLAALPYPVFFQQQGSLLLAHERDQGELMRFIGLLQKRLPDLQSIMRLKNDKLTALEPELSHFNDAYFLACEGQIDNRALLVGLFETLKTQGVAWCFDTNVCTVEPTVIQLQDQTLKFDWVFDCRGLGAKTQQPSLRGIRGEIIRVLAKEVSISRPVRLMHPRYRIYIAPRADHHYVIGATEIDSEDNSPVSLRSALELLSAAFAVHKGFAEARILSMQSACRPTYPDNLPVLRVEAGYVSINGLYRHGFLMAPALVETCLEKMNEYD